MADTVAGNVIYFRVDNERAWYLRKNFQKSSMVAQYVPIECSALFYLNDEA